MKQQVQLQIARNEKRSIFLQCAFAWIYPPVIAAHVAAGKYYGLAYLAFAAAFIVVSHRGIKAAIKLAIAQTQLDETLSEVADMASKLAASINHSATLSITASSLLGMQAVSVPEGTDKPTTELEVKKDKN